MEFSPEYGYAGLFLVSFLAATILPVIAEPFLTAMIIGGFNPLTCLIVATSGNFLGGMSTFALGYAGKLAWLQRWFRVKPEDTEKFSRRIRKYGGVLAFFSWVPFLGDPLTVALGLARTRVTTVMIFMLTGKALRYALWALLSETGYEFFI